VHVTVAVPIFSVVAPVGNAEPSPTVIDVEFAVFVVPDVVVDVVWNEYR
jgi:hypothetical protein